MIYWYMCKIVTYHNCVYIISMQYQHVFYQLYILFNLLLLSVAKTLLHDSICIACLAACVIFVRISTSLLYSKQLRGWPHVFEVLWISLMVSYGKDVVCRNTKLNFVWGHTSVLSDLSLHWLPFNPVWIYSENSHELFYVFFPSRCWNWILWCDFESLQEHHLKCFDYTELQLFFV